jgi:hypothetical protein
MVIKISAGISSYFHQIVFSPLVMGFILESSKDLKTTFMKTLFLLCKKLEHVCMQKRSDRFPYMRQQLSVI